jgi:hypothetical protein
MKIKDYIKEPWELIDSSIATSIKTELSEEIDNNKHPLNQVACNPIAKRMDKDEVLLRINPHLCEYAIVHLTWSGKQEKGPKWPHVDFFTDIDDLNKERFIPDYEDYN